MKKEERTRRRGARRACADAGSWIARAQRLRWEKGWKLPWIAKELGVPASMVSDRTRRMCECGGRRALGLLTCQRCHELETQGYWDAGDRKQGRSFKAVRCVGFAEACEGFLESRGIV